MLPASASVAIAPVAMIPSHRLMLLLLQLSVLLAVALLLGRLAARMGMPAVVGELLAGVLLGPSLFAAIAPDLSGWLFPREAAQFNLVDAIGQLGVLLLVGLAGTEIDVGLVKRRGTTAVRVSLGGLAVPLGFGVGIGFLLPHSLLGPDDDRTVFALFMGVAMCVSAIPVIAKTLIDMKLLHRNVGQLALCAATVDDAFGWLMLSVVAAMAGTGTHAGEVGRSVGYLLGVVVFALVLGRPAVDAVLGLAARGRDAMVSVTVVVVMILACAAATQALSLEAVLGAFVCGVLIGSSPRADRAALASLHSVVFSVLGPVFFAAVGLRTDLTTLGRPAVLLAALAVLAIAVVGKFAGAYLGARASRLDPWEALALGAAMNARGVIEVVVAGVGVKTGILDTASYTVIVLVAIVTSVMASPLLRFTMSRVEQTAEERLRETGGDRTGGRELIIGK